MSAAVQSVSGKSLTPTSLGQLAEYVTSGSRDWSKYYASSGAVFIRTQDIKRNRLSLDDVAHVALPERVEGKRSLVKKGDLLITITGANVGKVAVVDFDPPEAYVSQSVCLVRLKNPELAKFVQLQLIARKGDKSALEAMAYGLGRPVLNLENIRAAPVLVGSPEQHAQTVAEIEKQFSRLDEAVANLQRVKANLKRYKAAVLKAAVEGRLVETEASIARREGRGYETGDQLLRRVLVDRKTNWSGKGKYVEPATPDLGSLPALPDGWIWATAEAVCDPVVDCHNKTAPYVNSGIPLVRTTNIRDGQLLMDGMRFVDQPTYEFWSRRCPPASGDVLFTREAPMGEACIVPAGMTVCLGQRTMLMRPSPAITASFLLAALMSPVIGNLIDRVAVGSGVKHLRVGDVERLPIPLPPKAEQLRIVAELDRRLSVQSSVEAEVDANLQRAEALRQATLARTFVAAQ